MTNKNNIIQVIKLVDISELKAPIYPITKKRDDRYV